MTDAAAVNRTLEGATAPAILRWAAEHLGRLTFASALGAECVVVIDTIARERLPIDIFTLDTGLLFPETYELKRQLEARYGITIRSVAPAQTVAEQAATHGPALWERDPNRCCELRKIEPLRRALAGFDGWITAIRREQTPERANAQPFEIDTKFGLAKVNPLVAWTHDDVWAHIYAHDVPFNPLHHQNYPSIGCQPCTSPVLPGEDARSGRWRGAGKRECGLHLKADS